MLSNINFGKFVLVASLFNPLVADAFEGHLKIRHEIISLRPNCAIAADQINWLHSIKPTRQEISDARNSLFFVGGFSKYFWENRDISEGTIKWAVDQKIKEIIEECRG